MGDWKGLLSLAAPASARTAFPVFGCERHPLQSRPTRASNLPLPAPGVPRPMPSSPPRSLPPRFWIGFLVLHLLALAGLAYFVANQLRPVQLPALHLAEGEKLHCVSYAPYYKPGQTPLDLSTRIPREQIVADLKALAPLTGMDMVGCPAMFERVSGNDREFVDEWGVRYRTNQELVPHPMEGPLRTMDDVRRYRPPDPNAPGRLG